MGAYLNSPKTEKETEFFENEHYKAVASDMQGWRVSMEDAHVVKFEETTAYLAVFDGHGGKDVAIYAARNIVGVLKR
jgi:serine/threonine protein phosphatase PrpC